MRTAALLEAVFISLQCKRREWWCSSRLIFFSRLLLLADVFDIDLVEGAPFSNTKRHVLVADLLSLVELTCIGKCLADGGANDGIITHVAGMKE